MLAPFQRDTVQFLGDCSIDEAHGRALVEDARIDGLAVRVPVKEPVRLVVGEPEGILELLDGEHFDSHRGNCV